MWLLTGQGGWTDTGGLLFHADLIAMTTLVTAISVGNQCALSVKFTGSSITNVPEVVSVEMGTGSIVVCHVRINDRRRFDT